MDFYLFKLIKYQLYLLQLENYQLKRFWQLLFARGWFPRKDQRKNLVWTMKAKAILALAIFIHVGLTWLGFSQSSYLRGVSQFILLFLLYPIFFSLAVIILWPFDYLVKKIIIIRAKFKIRSLSNLKIIGVAGSYGKTTMKEVLKQVLGIRYKLLATPESVNTPVGIARWILNEVHESTEIAIVEMGEHYRGDIEELCNITKPQIAIISGINEAHLERMGSFSVVVDTIFEIIKTAGPGTQIFLNGDDDAVEENYEKYIWPDQKIEKFSIRNFKPSEFDPEKLVWKVEADEMREVEINLLGEYALGTVDAAIKVGKVLGMNERQIKQGILKIKPVEHRLQPIKSSAHVLVIDDSYNGNPDGAAEAIKVLSRFESRRKVYLTPGLVEMGKSTADVHREIGRRLAEVADVVVLIKNSVTPFIEEGIRKYELGIRDKRPKIIWFDTAQEAHAGLKNILQPWDVIVFQNDWGDNYI